LLRRKRLNSTTIGTCTNGDGCCPPTCNQQHDPHAQRRRRELHVPVRDRDPHVQRHQRRVLPHLCGSEVCFSFQCPQSRDRRLRAPQKFETLAAKFEIRSAVKETFKKNRSDILVTFVRRLFPITIVVLLACAGLSRTARAADSPDDKRPTTALAACASGDVAKGISILGELYAETRNPAYVFNQGRCYQKNNKLEEARGSFTEYLRIGTAEPPEDIRRAEGFIKELDESLERQRANQPTPIIVTPVQGGERRARVLRTTSIILAGLGVAAIGAGAYLSYKVKWTNDQFDKMFANQAYVTDEPALQKLVSNGKSYETWQWVGYGVGIAALAGAVTTFVLSGYAPPGAPAAPEPATPAEPEASVTMAPTLSPHGAGGMVQVRF
jgi:hypothetical protein